VLAPRYDAAPNRTPTHDATINRLHERSASRRAAYLLPGLAFVASALLLFVNLGAYPIILWDESRLAVNALEMLLTGPGVVTTYNFEPDLWNTKPPLLIWLMTASMELFGPSERAIRVPSAAAALATLAVVMAFSWRLTRSGATVLLACVLLVASPGFYGRHAAATGDYDALLTVFTTIYLCILFFAVHRRAPAALWVATAAIAIAAAILTKGVAGLIPGVGVVIYLVLTGRWRRPFVTPWYLVGAGIVLLACVTFYGLRELAAPGYLEAVLRNELTGRFLYTQSGHRAPFFFYVQLIVGSTFSAGPLLLLLPFGFAAATGRVRLGIVFGTCVAAAIVLVFSTSATKLPWYVVPAYPFLAVALALSAFVLAGRIVGARGASTDRGQSFPDPRAFALVLLAAAIAGVAILRHEPITRDAVGSQGSYDLVFANLHERGIRTVTVVEGGDRNADGLVHYAPRLRFYQLLWQTRSFTVREIVPDMAALTNRPGAIVVTCDPRYVEKLRNEGALVAKIGGCVSVRL
jgi:4-amino-4-deoxy-L-arabinose transferase-like glycosyltransferase